MGFVEIKNGVYYGKEISGAFTMIEAWKRFDRNGKNGIVKVEIDGKQSWIAVDQHDCTMNLSPSDEMINSFKESVKGPSDEEIDANIAKRFRVLNVLMEGVVSHDINALMIAGAPGCGKTYTIENRAGKALAEGELNNVRHIKGKMSAVVLYSELYNCRDKGDVVILDDVDISDVDVLNILKAVLDTGEKRTVHWGTRSLWLEEQGIPTEFDFNGCVIMLTNVNIDKEISSNGKFAPHYKALVSRCSFLDTKIHTNKEILIRIKQVVREGELFKSKGLNEEQQEEIMTWLSDNCERFREMSIRTVVKVASYVKTAGDDWKEMAEVLMLK